jgi:CubicO group peptidase (beta-lactamase class C family)
MTVEVESEYAQKLEAARVAAGVTGASFAYWDGETLHTAVAGLRNSVTRDPVTVDTVMHIGSVTKIMNTALLMQLVEDGKIRLEDPVRKHLPDLRLRDTAALERITCAMLVNHTSGIEGEWMPDYGPDQERIEDAIHRFAQVGQLHPPGEGPSYSNFATVIAGYLTQKLRGESWYSLMKSRIYRPLEMRHSLVDLADLPHFRCSVGDLYDPIAGKMGQTTRPFLALSLAPAGSTQMNSATDLVTFGRAMINGGVGPNGARILSAESAARMAQPTAKWWHPQDWYWGLGWMIMPGGVLHHAGGGPGVYSVLYAHPSSGRVVALLMNSSGGDGIVRRFLDPILKSWTGLEKRALERVSTPVQVARYEGTYEGNLTRFEVSSQDGALGLRVIRKVFVTDNSPMAPDGPTLPLYPVGDEIFKVAAGQGAHPAFENFEVRFLHPDATGRMRYLGSPPMLLPRTS